MNASGEPLSAEELSEMSQRWQPKKSASVEPKATRAAERKAEREAAAETARKAYIDKIVAAAPPLSDEQRARLAVLLRPVR